MFNVVVSPSPSIVEIEQLLHRDSSKVSIAAVRALNKTGRWLRTVIARELSEAMTVRVNLIRRRLVIFRASINSMTVSIGIRKRGLLIDVSGIGHPVQDKRGVRVGKHRFDSAFIVEKIHGKVFHRTTRRRLPIRLTTLNMSRSASEIMDAFSDQRSLYHFEKIFQHELKYVFRTGV